MGKVWNYRWVQRICYESGFHHFLTFAHNIFHNNSEEYVTYNALKAFRTKIIILGYTCKKWLIILKIDNLNRSLIDRVTKITLRFDIYHKGGWEIIVNVMFFSKYACVIVVNIISRIDLILFVFSTLYMRKQYRISCMSYKNIISYI